MAKAFAVPAKGGFNPAIKFKGKRYQWAGVYDSADIARQVARQLLESAESIGYVP